MTLKKQIVAATAVIAGLFATAADAGIVYSDFIHEGSEIVDYRVEVEHNQTAGQFDFTYQVTNNADVERLTGMFINISDNYNASNLGLSNEFNPSNELSCQQGFQVSKEGGKCGSTLNEGTFDIGVFWRFNDLTKGNGIGGFSISDLGNLTLANFGAIGMRSQAVNGDGSAKEVQMMPDAPVQASEPGVMAMLLIGMGGIFASRRRVRQN